MRGIKGERWRCAYVCLIAIEYSVWRAHARSTTRSPWWTWSAWQGVEKAGRGRRTICNFPSYLAGVFLRTRDTRARVYGVEVTTWINIVVPIFRCFYSFFFFLYKKYLYIFKGNSRLIYYSNLYVFRVENVVWIIIYMIMDISFFTVKLNLHTVICHCN